MIINSWDLAALGEHVLLGDPEDSVMAGLIQNLRRGPYKLAVDAPPALRIAAAFTELAQAI
ncbi:hypothetical protein [Micromonospora pattaloongensis]|uniref:hypothetical protein n=1 Tax=Micromonospora pattaloongensis TaxID=405436 RepID=UPI000B86EC85